jgi:hypothetical protein
VEAVGQGNTTDYVSAHEESGSSKVGLEEAANAHASSDESLCTYCFDVSTITIDRIRKMMDKGYFAVGDARKPGEETTPVPEDDEAVVFEDFIVAGLRMPPHPALTNNLLKFQAQLNQLMPNAISQLSKYFWAVDSFRGDPTADAFAKKVCTALSSKEGLDR